MGERRKESKAKDHTLRNAGERNARGKEGRLERAEGNVVTENKTAEASKPAKPSSHPASQPASQPAFIFISIIVFIFTIIF